MYMFTKTSIFLAHCRGGGNIIVKQVYIILLYSPRGIPRVEMESAVRTGPPAAIGLSTLTLRARVRVQSTETARGETCSAPRGDVLPRDSRFSANRNLL